MNKQINVFESIRFAFAAIKKHFLFFLTIILIAIAIVALQWLVKQYAGVSNFFEIVETTTNNFKEYRVQYNWSWSFLITFFISSTFYLLYTPGLINIALKIYDNQNLEFKDFYSGYSLAKFLLAQIWFFLIVICGILLFFIPAIIWFFRYFFVSYIVIDKNLSVNESMKLSRKITNDAKLKLFLAIIVLSFLFTFLTQTTILTIYYLYSKTKQFAFEKTLYELKEILLLVNAIVSPIWILAMTYIYRQLLGQIEHDQSIIYANNLRNEEE